jgi:DHA2 family multidrug resistance protein
MFSTTTTRTITPDEAAKRDRTVTLIALCLATAAEYWTSTGVSLILTDLTGTLSASSDEASWALTVYTTAFAVSIALSHRLSHYFGNRRYLASCAFLYAITSLGCALSPQLGCFLFFRALEGFAGGAFLVRGFVFFTQQYDPKPRSIAVTMYGLSFFFVGRFISPIVCGWMADSISWRLLFGFSALLMFAAAILFYRHAADRWIDAQEPHRLDFLGILLLLIGAGCIQAVLSRGEIDDWLGSPRIVALLLTGIAANLLFALWQVSSKNTVPLLNLSFLKTRAMYSAAIVGFALGILLAGSLYVIPQFLRNVESHSALQTGIMISLSGSASVAILCSFGPISALVMKVGAKTVIALALVIEMTSQLLLAQHLTTDTPDHFLWIPLALNGVFIALSVPILGTAAFAGLRSEEVSNARALYYGFRQIGASIGVTLAVILIDRRMTLHSARLFDNMFNRNMASIGIMLDPNAGAAARALANAVRLQSSVLSFADVFYVMAAFAGLTVFLVPLLPSLSNAATPVEHGLISTNHSTSIKSLTIARGDSV